MNGLVLEGGAMRGLFSAGITDVMMENDLLPDAIIGVSAGAIFGSNIKSGQNGRAIRYNMEYCRDWRYASLRSFLFTGDLYGADFCYRDLPRRLDIFDSEAFAASPIRFWVVCSDIDTGESVYRECKDASDDDLTWIRAGASMPLVSRIVSIEGRHLLDGGITDSIPVKAFAGLGYPHSIVILTQPEGYRKEPTKLLGLMKLRYRRYPALIKAMAERHIRYNETLDHIRALEKAGEILVIRPEHPLDTKAPEHDRAKLEAVYRHGRETGEAWLRRIRSFLAEG